MFNDPRFFLIKDYNPASISTSGYIRPTITPKPLDSKPRTEVKKQTRKYNHYTKETEDYASNLFSDRTSKLPTPSKPKHHKRSTPITYKATPSRRKWCWCRRRRSSEESEKCFHLEDKDQAGTIPTKHLQGGHRRPKTPPMLTLTP
jgi:hypothetical protein